VAAEGLEGTGLKSTGEVGREERWERGWMIRHRDLLHLGARALDVPGDPLVEGRRGTVVVVEATQRFAKTLETVEEALPRATTMRG